MPAWIVTCSNANPSAIFACIMQQSLQMQDTGQRIASVTIRKDGEQAFAIIQLPHGVSLSAGVDVSVDDGPVAKLPIESADQNGSYARLLMDDATSKAMRAGTILRIVATSMTGEQLKLEMSLSGFSKSQDILLTHG
ncbi:MAG: invasion associated locus B family protein [Rhizobiaceae bacterium]|nr:invasion associated locus B family protein [Rhizobiaceae bacterium]